MSRNPSKVVHALLGVVARGRARLLGRGQVDVRKRGQPGRRGDGRQRRRGAAASARPGRAGRRAPAAQPVITIDGGGSSDAACTPSTTCAPAGGQYCGRIGNGCKGGSLECGACAGDGVCTGGICIGGPSCQRITCSPGGGARYCGTVGDACGGKLECGACATGEVCTAGVCVKAGCVPLTCTIGNHALLRHHRRRLRRDAGVRELRRRQCPNVLRRRRCTGRLRADQLHDDDHLQPDGRRPILRLASATAAAACSTARPARAAWRAAPARRPASARGCPAPAARAPASPARSTSARHAQDHRQGHGLRPGRQAAALQRDGLRAERGARSDRRGRHLRQVRHHRVGPAGRQRADRRVGELHDAGRPRRHEHPGRHPDREVAPADHAADGQGLPGQRVRGDRDVPPAEEPERGPPAQDRDDPRQGRQPGMPDAPDRRLRHRVHQPRRHRAREPLLRDRRRHRVRRRARRSRPCRRCSIRPSSTSTT